MSAVVEELPTSVLHVSPKDDNHLETFLEEAVVRFFVPVSGHVTLKVFDAVGREKATLVSNYLSEGLYNVTWHAGEATTGAYWYYVQAKRFVYSAKFNLVK